VSAWMRYHLVAGKKKTLICPLRSIPFIVSCFYCHREREDPYGEACWGKDFQRDVDRWTCPRSFSSISGERKRPLKIFDSRAPDGVPCFRQRRLFSAKDQLYRVHRISMPTRKFLPAATVIEDSRLMNPGPPTSRRISRGFSSLRRIPLLFPVPMPMPREAEA